ncbi:uncharacterized protein LOC124274057 [Haliotis rubra]|uniref:uncharacterized protein LOC124274057 n=1 Tax=Haliotis rubra TaxID=36100 RepID=UPI001EE51CA3|nr:uncharacterized protein LOC124274057 [Haliotis rubra]
MDLVKVRNKFIWTWILAGICVSVTVTGRGHDAQNYTQDPYIVSPGRVQYGSDVNLTCYILIEVKFFTFISFTWKKNDERIIHGGNYEMSSGPGSFENSIHRYHTNTLTVKDTRVTDEGKRYMCQVELGVGTWSSYFHTDEYIFGQEVPSTTTTTASEGEDVTIFSTWRVITDDVIRFWSPSDRLIATIQSISVYIWPNYRSKVKVIRLITSHSGKTVKLMIINATKGDSGRYYLSDFKRRSFYGGHNLVIADVTSNTVTVTSTQTSAATTTGILLSTATTANTDQSVTTVVIYIIVGCCALFIVLTVFIVAAIMPIRIKRQDYWNLRSQRSYITPMQNMPENIDSQGYAEIDNADLLERGAGNLARPVGKIQSDDNIPPGARIRRERQQLERSCRKVDENDEYEEVKPLDAINSEELAEEQEKRAPMQQPDQDSGGDITGEMNITLPEASSY